MNMNALWSKLYRISSIFSLLAAKEGREVGS